MARYPGYFAFCSMVLLGFTPIFNLMEASDLKKVQFPILFFIAGCMAIGIVAGTLGIPAWLAGKLVPYLQQIDSNAGFVHVRLLGGRRRQPRADACRGGNVPERAHGRNRHLAEPWDPSPSCTASCTGLTSSSCRMSWPRP